MKRLVLIVALLAALPALAQPALFSRPRGWMAYEQAVVMPLTAKYGGYCWPLRDSASTTSDAARDLSGQYTAALSGTTYYNQVIVTGTLNPDATGTYTATGTHNGRPYYRRGSDNWFLWSTTNWNLTTVLGSVSGGWYLHSGVTLITGSYTPQNGATGTATLANSTGSGTYLFVSAGVTLQSEGPIVSGRVAKSIAFSGTGYVTCPVTPDPSAAFSVVMWANVANTDSNSKYAFGVAASASKMLAVRFVGATVRVGFSDGTGYAKSGTIASGVWQHIAVCKAAGSVAPALYIDGVAQVGTSAPSYTSNVRMVIGAQSSLSAPFVGSLAYVIAVPANLSATEVSALYLGATKGV